jgi:SAM-dependent methyltransferase
MPRRDDRSDELEEIRARYQRRAQSDANPYAFINADVLLRQLELEWAMITMLKGAGLTDFARLRLLEVGAGNGNNLLRFIRWGFRPENLVANELLPERVAAARKILPVSVEIVAGDARALERDAAFDIVLQSTVLSSILDDEFQAELAQTMWRHVAPGGALLSYDFAVNNPRNPDVRGVPVQRLRKLFPAGHFEVRRVSLAPPLARRVATTRVSYALLSALPFLRTHRLALIRRSTSP